MNFAAKSAIVSFDEGEISAQEVARAMAESKHMMGADMQYEGILLLSVPDAKDKAAGAKATAALSEVDGVAKVAFYPQQKAVGIKFADKGKVSTTQLIEALKEAGLKAAPYGPARKGK